ncbi:HAD hydrolase-like protein [Flexibacterium corallicola]|uniref:HAD hydrolase-like protein n=1 Tax=Flexibacterium corallicola TaxID=3037259 RepID=UPI00286F4088|nr:HAD hydrolase-like protein [Pseudovibrio sp. M1P-2-3]
MAIFDFDGTLATSGEWFYDVYNNIARKYKTRVISFEEYKMLKGRNPRFVISYLKISGWKLPILVREVRKMATRDVDMFQAYDWVYDVLKDLRELDVSIAVVSSNSEKNMRYVLGGQVASLIDYYSAGVSIFGKAPKFKKAIRKCKASHSSTFSIGDEIRDIEAARKVGIKSIAVSWGNGTFSSLKDMNPTAAVERPEEILTLFQSGSHSR